MGQTAESVWQLEISDNDLHHTFLLHLLFLTTPGIMRGSFHFHSYSGLRFVDFSMKDRAVPV